MEITETMIARSVARKPFGDFEPFISGKDKKVEAFYDDVLTALKSIRGITVVDGKNYQGYASYVAFFLYPSDGRSRREFPSYTEITGVLLYMSRLAPIAVYGESFRSSTKDHMGGASGSIEVSNVGILPDKGWKTFINPVIACLHSFGIEVLPRESLIFSAPKGISVPSTFEGPYFIFDTLFYWND